MIKKHCILLISTIVFLTICNNSNETTKIIEYNYINDLKHLKSYYDNNDIVGRIKIEGTGIDNIIVKGSDNEYYLSHSIDKEKDEKGAIFLDYRVNLNSKQVNIYGHNSITYNLPFKELEKYLNKDFYDNHKYVTIWNGEKENNYIIFSIKIVNDNKHMNLEITENYINYLNDSLYDTKIKATTDDNILILQTCNYTIKDTYILIIAKKCNSTI